MAIVVFLSFFVVLAIGLLLREERKTRIREKQIEKELRKQWEERREKNFSPYEMEQISYLAKTRADENRVDELTWENLEMDKVYQKLCYCQSSLGEEYFYFLLRNPMRDWKKLEELEEKLQCLSDIDTLVFLQKELIKLGKIKKHSMREYLDLFWKAEGKGNLFHYLGIIFLFLSFFWMNISLFTGFLFFMAVLLFQIITYFKAKAELEPYLVSLRYLFRMGETAKKVIPLLPKEWQKEKEVLEKITKTMKEMEKGSGLLLSFGKMSGQGMEVIFDYVRMIFHPDIIKYNRIVKTAEKYKREIEDLYAVLGELDSCLSIVQYRHILKVWTVPKEEVKEGLNIKGGYHPLVQEPVTNDLELKKCLLLTGSNASGKSTFLKMMGVNLLLGQSVNTCLAEDFSYPTCRVFTCLWVKDSLERKESYYMAEIKAIKGIFDASCRKEKVICLIDEVLRGTNTMERIAASAEILLEMRKKGMIVLAATHDRELTEILEKEYENYHFGEVIENQDIHFSFKLLPGRADSSNAIFLLSHIGYDSSIVHRAKERLEKIKGR